MKPSPPGSGASLRSRFNLNSPNSISSACRFDDLKGWFQAEATLIEPQTVRAVIEAVGSSLDSFVTWPSRAILLWRGCDRRSRTHSYPDELKRMARARKHHLDTRANGPAILAFELADGKRGKRFGSTNAWTIHHIYSGKFPYPGRAETTWAAREPEHFSQSAGLVATHPIADQMCDEYPFFAWLLRAIAFQRFGYDPDEVFATGPHVLGFAPGRATEIIYETTT